MRKSRFTPKLKQQEKSILEQINSVLIYCSFKIHFFNIFVQVQSSKQTYNFIILGNLDFLQKQFYNINYKALIWLIMSYNLIPGL